MRIVFSLFTAVIFPVIALGESASKPSALKVGVILPLTGPLAEYGIAVRNGIELARREKPLIDSRCSFLMEDSRYDSSSAVTIFQKLVSTNQARVIYNWGGPTSEALAPIAARKDVPLFVWSADPRVSEGRPPVIRFANSGADYGKMLANHLRKRGFRKVAIFKTDNQYLDAIFAGLTAAATGLQVDLVDSFQPGDKHFRSSVAKLKRADYDAVGLFLLSGQVSLFSAQLRGMGLQMPIFGTDFFESMTEVEQSKGALIGATFANNEVSADFLARYIAAFGNEVQINHAANGFDFAVFLCERLGPDLNMTSSADIVSRTLKTSRFTSQQGEASFIASSAGDKYFHFPVVIRRIESSRIVTDTNG